MEDSIAVVDGGGNQDIAKIKEEHEPVVNEDDILIKEAANVLEEDETLVAKPLEGLRDGGPPPFLKKIFEMVEDPRTDSIISWSESRKSFVLWDTHKFSKDLLPQRFKHNNFSSFVRQLNTYKFKKINPDRWEFANELFQKGKKHLLKDIKRRTNQAKEQQSELKKLEFDTIQLKQEILKMKKQQENTEKHMFSVHERMRRTEQKQQYLVDFVSKVFKHPGFVQILQRGSVEKSQIRITDHDEKKRDHNVFYPHKSGSPLEDANSYESFTLSEKLLDKELMFGIEAHLDMLMAEPEVLMPDPVV